MQGSCLPEGKKRFHHASHCIRGGAFCIELKPSRSFLRILHQHVCAGGTCGGDDYGDDNKARRAIWHLSSTLNGPVFGGVVTKTPVSEAHENGSSNAQSEVLSNWDETKKTKKFLSHQQVLPLFYSQLEGEIAVVRR
ncbi:hypothetical protein MRX96_009697 [Rhipicephalus microplus]